MNGVHDMGGMHGMGPVEPEPNEPVFHHEWERRVFALALATGFLRRWNIDMGRFAIERMPPAEYLRATYYEKWLARTERLLVERGLLSADELTSGRPDGRPPAVRALPPAELHSAVRNRRAARMDDHLKAPTFKPGDRVRTRNVHPEHHTRLPRYARDKVGVVDRDHGVFILPDEHASSGTKVPSHCYAVRFEGRELWGPHCGPRDAVYIDLFDEYLEPVNDGGGPR
ncbi:MAG TPA: nitrile hydratase subunit beta [Methylomirabilota bacterium]|jgi:nitrile hydratase|nr:nitrile hydratase subunit beta [Methylomirabilota bacterium]